MPQQKTFLVIKVTLKEISHENINSRQEDIQVESPHNFVLFTRQRNQVERKEGKSAKLKYSRDNCQYFSSKALHFLEDYSTHRSQNYSQRLETRVIQRVVS